MFSTYSAGNINLPPAAYDFQVKNSGGCSYNYLARFSVIVLPRIRILVLRCTSTHELSFSARWDIADHEQQRRRDGHWQRHCRAASSARLQRLRL